MWLRRIDEAFAGQYRTWVYHHMPAMFRIVSGLVTNLAADFGGRTRTVVVPGIMAVDFGTKRIGLAVSDAQRMMARCPGTLGGIAPESAGSI